MAEIRQLCLLMSKKVTYRYHLEQSLHDMKVSLETAKGYLQFDPYDLGSARVRSIVKSFAPANNQVCMNCGGGA